MKKLFCKLFGHRAIFPDDIQEDGRVLCRKCGKHLGNATIKKRTAEDVETQDDNR